MKTRKNLRTSLVAIVALVAGVLISAGPATSAPVINPYPHGLWKEHASDTAMTLRWWPISGAKSYGVCVTPSNKAVQLRTCDNGNWYRFFPQNGKPDSPLDNKSYTWGTVSGLERNTTYKFQVRAYGDESSTYAKRLTDYGTTSPALQSYKTELYAMSSAPGGLKLAVGTDNSLIATWNNVASSTYEVRFSTGAPNKPAGAANCSIANCVRSDVPRAVLPNLTEGATYNVTVRAVDQKTGEGDNPYPRSPWSANVSKEVKSFPIASPEWGATVDLTKQDFTLRWAQPSGFDPAQHRFLVYVSDASGIRGGNTDAWLTDATSQYVTAGNGTKANGNGISSITQNKSYYANIAVVPKAFDLSKAGDAAYTDAQRLSDYPPQTTLKTGTNTFAAVRDLSFSEQNKRLRATWAQVPRAGNRPYKVYVGTAATGTADWYCVTDANTSDGTVSYVFNDLPGSTTLFFEVALAEGNCTGSAAGPWPSARTQQTTPNQYDLAAPAPFRLVGSGPAALQVAWNHDTGGQSPRYQVNLSPKPSKWASANFVTAAGAEDAVLTDLDQNKTYTLRVRAVAANGTTALSPWSISIKAATNPGYGSISGQVNGPAAATSELLAIAYSQGGNRDGEIRGVARVGTDGKYTINELPAGTYRVRLEQAGITTPYVSAWAKSGTASGGRIRSEGTNVSVSCPVDAGVCPTRTAPAVTIQSSIALSGALPAAASGGYVTVMVKGSAACTAADLTRSPVRVTGRIASGASTYTVHGLYPSSMGGSLTYCVYLDKDSGNTALATKQITLSGAGNGTLDLTDGVAPPVPTGLAANATGANTGQVTWNASSGATTYRLWYGTDPNGSDPKPTMVETSGTTANLTGLSPNTTYYVDISAIGPGGQSAYTSPRKSFKTSGGGGTPTPGTPATPTGFAVSSTTANAVTLTWNASSGASEYRLWYGTNANGTKATMHTATGTSTTITGLSANTTYYFDVAARNASGGQSAYTNRISGKTKTSSGSATVPATPGGFTISSTTTTSAALTWNASSGATSYRIWYGTSANGSGAKLHTATGTSTTITGLSANTTYYFDIAAANANGWSAYTPRTSAKTKTASGAATVPATPTGFAVSTTSTSATLTWNATSGAEYYRIWYGTNADGSKATLHIAPGTSTTITGLSPNTTYYFDIAAANGGGWSAYTPRTSKKTTS